MVRDPKPSHGWSDSERYNRANTRSGVFVEKQYQEEWNDKQQKVGGDVMGLGEASVLDAEPVVDHQKVPPPGRATHVGLVGVDAPRRPFTDVWQHERRENHHRRQQRHRPQISAHDFLAQIEFPAALQLAECGTWHQKTREHEKDVGVDVGGTYRHRDDSIGELIDVASIHEWAVVKAHRLVSGKHQKHVDEPHSVEARNFVATRLGGDGVLDISHERERRQPSIWGTGNCWFVTSLRIHVRPRTDGQLSDPILNQWRASQDRRKLRNFSFLVRRSQRLCLLFGSSFVILSYKEAPTMKIANAIKTKLKEKQILMLCKNVRAQSLTSLQQLPNQIWKFQLYLERGIGCA